MISIDSSFFFFLFVPAFICRYTVRFVFDLLVSRIDLCEKYGDKHETVVSFVGNNVETTVMLMKFEMFF